MTNTESAQRLAEIRARLEAATAPGEWEYNKKNPSDTMIYNEDGPVAQAFTQEDIEFIVGAAPDIEWLLNLITKLDYKIFIYEEKFAKIFDISDGARAMQERERADQ